MNKYKGLQYKDNQWNPAYFNKHNVTFIKLETNDVNMITSWCYCFPRYKVFGCFSLKETEKFVEYLV